MLNGSLGGDRTAVAPQLLLRWMRDGSAACFDTQARIQCAANGTRDEPGHPEMTTLVLIIAAIGLCWIVADDLRTPHSINFDMYAGAGSGAAGAAGAAGAVPGVRERFGVSSATLTTTFVPAIDATTWSNDDEH